MCGPPFPVCSYFYGEPARGAPGRDRRNSNARPPRAGKKGQIEKSRADWQRGQPDSGLRSPSIFGALKKAPADWNRRTPVKAASSEAARAGAAGTCFNPYLRQCPKRTVEVLLALYRNNNPAF
jgi:hypothetical protein